MFEFSLALSTLWGAYQFCADAGYRKTFEQDVSSELGLGVDISVRIKPHWEVLPKRWIVERSLAWLNNSRRLSKDYEISVCSAQAVCIIAASRTLLNRFYNSRALRTG